MANHMAEVTFKLNEGSSLIKLSREAVSGEKNETLAKELSDKILEQLLHGQVQNADMVLIAGAILDTNGKPITSATIPSEKEYTVNIETSQELHESLRVGYIPSNEGITDIARYPKRTVQPNGPVQCNKPSNSHVQVSSPVETGLQCKTPQCYKAAEAEKDEQNRLRREKVKTGEGSNNRYINPVAQGQFR